MGVLRRTGQAGMVAALLCVGARAAASVQVDPIARLTLEGGYDSNINYEGRGNGMGRVSPDLGVQLRDHTWSFGAVAGGDLYAYPNQPGSDTLWNQRGGLVLHLRPSERVRFDGEAAATYAFDPIGLARLGIFNQGGRGLVGTGRARGAYRLDRDWTAAGTFATRVVRFDEVPIERIGDPGALGAASFTPGVELVKRLGHRMELGASYKFDWFQEFGTGARSATAHEVAGVLRYRWTRRWTVEATAGPALWDSPDGNLQVVPQGSLQLLGANHRLGEVRFTLNHGVGLGILARPGLFDAVEAAATWNATRKLQLHVDGGLWRSGDIPWGANAVTGYGVDADVSYLVGAGVRVGAGASRFARADAGSSQYDRNIVGLRVGWELQHH